MLACRVLHLRMDKSDGLDMSGRTEEDHYRNHCGVGFHTVLYILTVYSVHCTIIFIVYTLIFIVYCSAVSIQEINIVYHFILTGNDAIHVPMDINQTARMMIQLYQNVCLKIITFILFCCFLFCVPRFLWSRLITSSNFFDFVGW